MADKSIYGNPSSATDERGGVFGPYMIGDDGIIIHVDSSKSMHYNYTDDNWATWSTGLGDVLWQGDAEHFAVWFDRQTPGDSGTKVHVIGLDSDTGNLYYENIDIVSRVQGGVKTVAGSLTISGLPNQNRCCITKTVSGNLVVGYSTQTEIGCHGSNDLFVSDNNTLADVYETATEEDYVVLFPAETADDDDAVAMFWDRSAAEISLKMYDNSADTWTETSVATSVYADAYHINMGGAVRHSDGHVIGAAHSNDDSTGDNLLVWDFTVDSISAPTVTSKTNVFSSQAESAQVAVLINQDNDYIYIAHLKGGTWQSSVDVAYNESQDGGATWESVVQISEGASDDVRAVGCGGSVDESGAWDLWFSFYNDDTTTLHLNSAEIGGASEEESANVLFFGNMY